MMLAVTGVTGTVFCSPYSIPTYAQKRSENERATQTRYLAAMVIPTNTARVVPSTDRTSLYQRAFGHAFGQACQASYGMWLPPGPNPPNSGHDVHQRSVDRGW